MTNKQMQQRDKMALASVAMCNPLMLIGMGATMAVAEEMSLARERELATKDDGKEELYKAGTVRELKWKKEREARKESGFKPSMDALTMSLQMPENIGDAKKKTKLSFLRDKVIVSRGVTMNERDPETNHSRNWVKANKLLKQKRMLQDHLEKFRGKLDLKTVSNLMSQMERLDKALAQFGY